ncbi:hemicentin-1-like [Branchiostoma floridae x Branchiostoma japonicum]
MRQALIWMSCTLQRSRTRTIPPRKKCLKGTKDVHLTCYARGNPTPEYVWFAPNTSETVRDKWDLFIREVQPKDAGVYRCEAFNDEGMDQTIVELVVQEPPEFAIKVPQRVSVAVNESFQFVCNATGNPIPAVTWLFKSEEVTSMSDMYGALLALDLVQREDEGNYTCLASSPVGDISTQMELLVKYPPSAAVSSADNVVEAGQSQLTLTCHVSGYPSPEQQWYKDGNPLVGGDRVETAGSHLTIHDVQANDTGDYACVAYNDFGMAQAWASVFVQVPPTIHAAPVNTSVFPGENVEWACEATGIPTPMVRWYKDGFDIYTINANGSQYYMEEESGYLTVLEADASTEGVYTCYADSEAGVDSASAWLKIYTAPTLYASENETYLQGDPVEILCLADGYPDSVVMWTFQGDPLTYKEGMMVEEAGMISIEQVTLADAGLYQCNASNFVGWSEASVYITVHTPPGFILHPSDVEVFPGDTTYFSCNATGVPTPQISWTFHPKTPGSGQLHPNQSLTSDLWVVNAGYQDEGIYQCTASNTAGNVTTMARLNILTPSNITVPPSNLTLLKGQTAEFPCGAVGFPPPDVTWTFQNTTIDASSHGSKYQIEETGMLVVKAVDLADVGWYSCTADNGVGNDSASAYLTVHVPAHFRRSPRDQAVTHTQNVVFYCEAGGVPTPRLHWRWNGSPTLGKGVHVSQDGRSLVIHFASYYHEGRYTCVASNTVGRREGTASLRINRKPVVTSISNPRPVKEGHSVVLECLHKGYPPPEVQWFHNKSRIHVPDQQVLGQKYYMNRKGVLQIHPVTWEDTGLYMCEVSNSLGSDMAKTGLVVWVAPRFTKREPYKTKEIFVYEKNVTLGCQAVGFPAPLIKWYRETDGRPMGLSDHQRFTVTGDLILTKVTKDDKGTYVCNASSDAGYIEDRIDIKILVAPVIYEGPFNRSVIVGGMARFRCKAHGQPDPKISWTYQPGMAVPFNPYRHGLTAQGREELPFDRARQSLGDGEELTITEVTRHDHGIYVCEASGGSAGKVWAMASLTVHGPPIIVEHPQSVVFTGTKKIVMRCYATGEGPLRYIWKRKGRKIGTGTRILLPVPDAIGQYHCEVSNNFGKSQSRVAVVRRLGNQEVDTGHGFMRREQLSFEAEEAMTNFANEFANEFYPRLREQLADQLKISINRVEYLRVYRGMVTFDLAPVDAQSPPEPSYAMLAKDLKQRKRSDPLTVKFDENWYGLVYIPPPEPTPPKPVETRTVIVEKKVKYRVTVHVPWKPTTTPHTPTPDTELDNKVVAQDDDIDVGVLVGTVVGTIVFLSCIFISITVWRSYFADKKTPKSPHQQFSLLQHGFGGVEGWGNRGDRFELEYHPPPNMIKSKPMGYLTLKRLVEDIKNADDGALAVIKQEFESVPLNQAKIHHTPCGTEQKNRYMNVLPNPHTSVKLLQLNSDTTTEYINANHIRGYDRRQNAYIAAQGPLGTTRQDFWRMVWEQNVDIIVMTTGLVERDRVKCARYWPNSSGKTKHEDYGDLIVTVLSEDKNQKYAITRMELQHKDASEVRHIWHYWYTSWPDFGVPDEPDYILDLLEDMNCHRARSKPVIVHCSAGLGRTGAFIGIDMGMEQIQNESIVDPLLYFTRIRQDRGGSVQTLAQYIFIHQVLLLYFKRKRSELSMQTDLTRLSMSTMSQGTSSLTQLTAML